MSAPAISRALTAGRLHRIHPGVYAVGHRALPIEGHLTAALLHAGPGAALSHTTAGWWWGVLPNQPSVIHVSVSHRRRLGPGFKVHQPRQLVRVFHRGLPVTPISRTLLDLASILPFYSLRRALAQAVFLRQVDLAEVEAALTRGRPGSAALRDALRQHRPELARTRSVLEERFLDLCERFDLPIPEINVPVRGFIVDALWREARLVAELDGRAAHDPPAAMVGDRERDLTLREAGYRVLRYSWHQIADRSARVADDLRRALRLL